jgi:hypothetical protein
VVGAAISISEAARRLGLTPARVRAMVADGLLHADKPGRDLFLDPDAVLRLSREPRRAGRRLSAQSCWRLLMLAEGEHLDGVTREEARRDRARLALLSHLEPGALAGRARVLELIGNPGVLKYLLDDPRVVRGGLSAAADYGADIVGGERAEGYVAATDVDAVKSDYALDPKPSGERANVILRVPEPRWPFPPGATHVSSAVVGADLVDSADERGIHAGLQLLTALVDRQRS